MHRRAVSAALVLVLLLGACGVEPAGASKLQVIATHSILGDLAQNVGGELVAVTTLVGPGGDAHTFEPSPADSAKIASASVLFENGLGFEPWLDEIFAASGSRATRVVVTEGVALIEAGEHGEYDPHVWHDVGNAAIMVEAIRAALATADPANAAAYQSNAERYAAELARLDIFVQEQVAQIPPDRRRLVTSHDTFGYFARRYGFEIIGSGFGSVSTEAGDPSAGDLAALVQEIRGAGVPAIFAENTAGSDLMETIAREAGVTLAPALYTDALGEPGSPGATYVDLMRYNATTIASALKG